MSAYVRTRQDTSGYVRIRQDMSAYVRTRQDTSGYVSMCQDTSGYVRIRQDTSMQEVGAQLVGAPQNREESRTSGVSICTSVLVKQVKQVPGRFSAE
jgi:hypothetical protein